MTETIFWAAVQGIGTVLAAIAAMIALVLAGRQLGELVSSNKLLTASNNAMTESNVALTRPYVVVDLEFLPSVSRSGETLGTSVFVVIKNDGKTAAHNIRMSTDRPFESVSEPNTDGWRKSLEDLNRMANGATILRSLTNTRPLKYYLDGTELFGKADEPGPSWTVSVDYEDGEGRGFHDSFALEVEAWRRSIVIADPLVRIGKYIDSVAHEVKSLTKAVNS
ncbi:hypothetical protein [Microbacterium murale]|uniref:Uncharacterized protein n=1 Tax=Microbacterium murale TaxID=1081040 RepID=A0ABU0P3Y2_9MICO|nr:hypothetical protein [Microbacterium murale]MDQ0642044.1 hypothetical protein [Microbacterium murale]